MSDPVQLANVTVFDSEGNLVDAPVVTVLGDIGSSNPTVEQVEVEHTVTTADGAHSFQGVASDVTLEAGAGSSDGASPKYLAAGMGNIFGTSLTADANYIAGLIGAYSVLGTKATTYPAGAVLGQITDGVTQADGAFVAYIDGDSAQTKAGAAFTVRNNNSVPGSGFNYGLDLLGAAHDGFPAVVYLLGELRFSNGTKVTVSGDTIVFTNAAGNKSATITMS